jgi:hypothetical protein
MLTNIKTQSQNLNMISSQMDEMSLKQNTNNNLSKHQHISKYSYD